MREGVEIGEVRQANARLFGALSRQAEKLPGSPFRLPVALQEAFNARFAAERASFAAKWFDSPATPGWLMEKVEPPTPLLALPFAPIAAAIDQTATALRKAGLTFAPEGLSEFATRLPVAEVGGKTLLMTEHLAEHFALAPEVEPPAKRLKHLMTAKSSLV
jgi:hypothetical protein